jgi:hypothetical protein
VTLPETWKQGHRCSFVTSKTYPRSLRNKIRLNYHHIMIPRYRHFASYNKTNYMHLFLKFILEMKLYMFRTVPLSIIRSFSLYTQQWYMSYRFADSCQQTCMTYTIAVCTMKNSWWWTEELSETCGVSFREYIWEISASGWFYYKKLEGEVVTMEHFFKCLNYFLFNFFFWGRIEFTCLISIFRRQNKVLYRLITSERHC